MSDLVRLRPQEVPGTQKAMSHLFKSPFFPLLQNKQSLQKIKISKQEKRVQESTHIPTYK